ncbi:protein piccolo isoform X5 [Silurus asotus]|uniref:Protein piccolo n=1 Tax=Silurus asotus TaxID=30991 RepID=A0AAD5AVV9_SILAS|nr:protein piccolo isoform X5 [Silurus asotus]
MCGFSPPDAAATEWLCLNCQMQRALGVEESPTPLKSSKTSTTSPSPVKQTPTAQKKDTTQSQALHPSSSQQSKPSEGHKAHGQDCLTTATTSAPHPQQKPTQQQKIKEAPLPAKSEPPTQPEPPKEQSGFFGFRSSGARSRSPSPQPTVSAVSGKVLGFGSSFFSSASNLISSAVQDESSTMQPISRKASSVSQSSDRSTPPVSHKGSEASKDSPKPPTTPKQEQTNTDVTQTTKTTLDQTKEKTSSSQSPKASPKSLSKACPICKVGLKKEPPNYNTCTECKTTVCNQCGFNPMPYQPEKTEWLCLNCHTKRASGISSVQFSKIPPSPQNKKSLTMSDHPDKTKNLSDKTIHKDQTTAEVKQKDEISAAAAENQVSQQHSALQHSAEKTQKASKVESSSAKDKPPQENSGFFGIGGGRSRSPSPQPAVSAVTGKMLGFGSSFFSSASNIISSAVLDEASTTQSTSRKDSTVSQSYIRSDTPPPSSRKGSRDTQASQGDFQKKQTDTNKSQVVEKKEGKKSEHLNPTESNPEPPKMKESSQVLPKSCPLCKVEIKSYPPNYNTCTDCRNIVCVQCGFNPSPHQKEMKEWLCLNCQMQRTSGPPEPTQTKPVKVPAPASPQENVKTQVSLQNLSPQQGSKGDTSAKPVLHQTSKDKSVTGPSHDKSQSSSPYPASSTVSENIVGFSPTIISTASDIISSAVKDEVSMTPPSSHKSTAVADASVKTSTPPASRKDAVVSEKSLSFKELKSVSQQPGSDEKISELQIIKEQYAEVKKDESLSACPLCKGKIKNNPPNVNTCTSCKMTVCNFCGFNPMPDQTEVSEWLCLSCQMQRAPGPPAKTPSEVNKVPSPASPRKKETAGGPLKNQSPLVNAKEEKPPGVRKTVDKPGESQKSTTNPLTQPSPTKSAPPQKVEPPKEESSLFGFSFSGPPPTQQPVQPTQQPRQETTKVPPAAQKQVAETTDDPHKKPRNATDATIKSAQVVKKEDKSRPPSPQLAASAVSEKVRGFGSFFSSASNLISSAIQDEPSNTPPTSRKSSTISLKNTSTPPPSHKSAAQQQEEKKEKENKLQDQLAKETLKKEAAHLELLKACPLCKADLKEDPPNYNTCTQCKNIVCSLCGFSPVPQENESKKWLCLDCHKQQAPGPPPKHPQQEKPSAAPKQEAETTDNPEKKPKLPIDATIKDAEVAKKEDNLSTAESQKPIAVQSAQRSSSDTPAVPKNAETSKEGTSFFSFSSGSAKSPSPKPDVTAVSEKVRGFGSSFFSSASNLISSTLQDEPPTTPPTSRKGSTISQRSEKDTPTPHSLHKETTKQKEVEKTERKITSDNQSTVSSPFVVKDEHPNKLLKSCPLCKVALTEDPHNYDTCTECKTTVCNLCGFSPMSQKTEVKEWLCLNCQMQRAPGAQPQEQVNKVPPSSSPQQKVKLLAGKPEDKPTQAETMKSISTPAKQQSISPTPKAEPSKKSSFFGFGGARSRSPSPQPAVSGKVLGFGSSLFSSASNLISSAVHDEPATPPTPRKGSVTSHTTVKPTPATTTSQKQSLEPEKHLIKENKTQPTEENPTDAKKQEDKLNEKQVEITKATDESSKVEETAKNQNVACPLCKIPLNVGTNEAPNFNTCTECKTTVCNLCGFNLISYQTEVSEWLCLTCQTQRALKGIELQEPQAKLDIEPTSTLSPSKIKPKTDTEIHKIQAPNEDADQNVASNLTPNENISNAASAQVKDVANDMVVKEAQEKETVAEVVAPTKDMVSIKAVVINEDHKSGVPQKPEIDQETTGKTTDSKSEINNQVQSKSSTPEQKISKQESGLFGFGFSSTKSQSIPSKPSNTGNTEKLFGFGGLTEAPSPQSSSVSGKVLGFGSSIFSSASNLISSAVHDEPSTTPQSSRKGSTVSQASIKSATPPSSRKSSAVSQTSLKTPPTTRKGSAASQSSFKDSSDGDVNPSDLKKQTVEEKLKVKVDGTSSEPAKPPDSQKPIEKTPVEKSEVKLCASLQPTANLDQSICPICKVQLNMASEDLPNFNSCTECNSIVCSQCGFDPMPNQTKVKHWLCMNCQKQRAERGIELTKDSMINPHPTFPKKNQSPTLESKLVETSTVHVDGKTASDLEVAKKDLQNPSSNENVPPPKKELPQQKAQIENEEKSQIKPSESPARSTLPLQPEIPKQQSSFFGFGISTGKSQPTSSKSSESTTGKRFGFSGLTETARSRSPSPQSMTNAPGKFLGFGSTIFSSASNLISSALQDESSPPVSRKGSTVSQSSTPPTSRKGSIISTGEHRAPISKKLDDKPVAKKTEDPNVTETRSSLSEKQEAMQVKGLPKSPSIACQLTCPLCKMDLNVGSEEPSNYKTCTECKDMVCNLCGFNPMPHLAEGEWLCLKCQTQRALSGKLGDMGDLPRPLPTSGAESAVLPTAQTIKGSQVVQGSETPVPVVLKPASKEQIVVSKVHPVESIAAPPASVQSTESTANKAADKTDELKCPSQELTVKEENLTLDEPLQIAEIPPSKAVVKTHDSKKDLAFPDKVIQNEETIIQLNIAPTTPSEHESTVLSGSLDNPDNLKVNDKKDPQGHNVFPVLPESYSSSDEELKEIQKASESLLKETEADLALIKETVCTKHFSGEEEFIQTHRKQTSADKDLQPAYHQSYIKKDEVSDAGTESIDQEAERIIKQLNVAEESADSYYLSQDQEDQLMANPLKTFLLDDNKKEETTDLNSTGAISVQQNVTIGQISEEESLAEDMSKDGGSSSVHASHITSGTTSPTSLSSLGEESDSSLGHKKESLEGKQHRKVKHRQGQLLQTVAGSSEEDEILEKGDQHTEQEMQRETDQRQFKKAFKKSNKEKDKLLDHPSNNHSPIEGISPTDEVLQFSEIQTYETFSYSNISPSTESEQETVPSQEMPPVNVMLDVEEKPLKSADEAYEEMMQKAQKIKAMTKKITPPDIEPLYGGMLIEDYVYESLVEEPALAIGVDHNITLDEYLTNVSVPETERKLRTPEEAYKEMQKNRELLLKDQTFEQLKELNKSAPYSNTTVNVLTDSCFVNMSESYEFTKQQDENWQWYAETANDELLNRDKEVMTPETSPTQSTPLSPVSPLSSSEPLDDSAEVIQIPLSGEEDSDKDEFAAEPIECAMMPFKADSTSAQDQPAKNVLYPIPDLKITQCSSGEEEAEDEESITQEYEIVMLNGISQGDDRLEEVSEFKDSLIEAQSVESEPTSVVSEVPPSSTKSATEHESLVSPLDSQASPLSPQDLTAFASSLGDQIAVQTSDPPKTYVAESSTRMNHGFDSAHVIISMAELTHQDVVQPTPFSEIAFEEVVSTSQVAESTEQTTNVSTILPSMSVTKFFTPKPTAVPSTQNVVVSESSVTPEAILPSMPLNVSISKPSLALKPSFTPKPTTDAVIVTIQDGVSQPDSVLQTVDSKIILEPTNLVYYSTLMSTSTVTSVSSHEQIIASNSGHTMSVTSNSFVPHVVFSTSECPIQVPSFFDPRYTGREHTSPAIVSEPVTVIVEMPDLMSLHSSYPIHSIGTISTLAHTPALTYTSAIDKGPISAPSAVSTYSSIDSLSPVQSVSVAQCVSSSSVEQSYICSSMSEPTKPNFLGNSFIQRSQISPPILASDTTVLTPAIKTPISYVDEDKLLVETKDAHKLPVEVSQTNQYVEHSTTNIFPTISTTVTFVTQASLPTQSTVEDTKPNNFQPAVDVSRIATPTLQTAQGTAIIVPSVEKETKDLISNTMAASIQQVSGPHVVVSISPVICSETSTCGGPKATLPSDLTFVSAETVPQVTTISRERADKPVIEFPPPPAASPPALLSDSSPSTPFNQQSLVSTNTEPLKSIASQAPGAAVKQVTTTIHKSPPPVPPKPFCVPSGLVFSHKTRESVKPSVIAESAVVHAATLPRTREPPKALPLSLTAPTDIKHSISSPKSPLSPRFAKTLETYVVITLPSEPGSPVEGVTTQAPLARSFSSPKHHGTSIVSTIFTSPVVSAPVTLISKHEVATTPKMISAPVLTSQYISGKTGDSVADVTSTMILTTVAPASNTVSVPNYAAPNTAYESQIKTGVLPIKMYEEKTIYSSSPMTTIYTAPTVFSIPTVTSPVLTKIPDMTIDPKINTVPTGILATGSVPVPHSVATSHAFQSQIETVLQPIKRETCDEKAIYSVPPVTATIYPAPTVVTMPTVALTVVTEIPDMSIEPKINTPSAVFSEPASSPAFVPQIETDTVEQVKNEILGDKSIYSASSVYPSAATSPDTLLAVTVVAEIPSMSIEQNTNKVSTVIPSVDVCASHISSPQTNGHPVAPISLLKQEIPVKVMPTAFTEGFTPLSSREPLISHGTMQGLERQSFQTVYPAPKIMNKLPLTTENQGIQMLEMEEQPKSTKSPSFDQIKQHQVFLESQQMTPSVSTSTYIPTTPLTFANFKQSVESQEKGSEKVLSSMSQLYSTHASTEQHQFALPNLLAQVVKTEVQRTTTVSVVQERIPFQPILDTCKQATLKPSEKTHCSDNVIDLTTLKGSVSMTDNGIDLTAPDSNLQSFLTDSINRQITTVQPEIVNLSAEITPATTLSVVTDSITVVACTATITYNSNITVDTHPSVQSVTSIPLPLKTYKQFQPLAQIVYRPVNSIPYQTTSTEIPFNLSFGPADTTAPSSLPVIMTPIICTPSSELKHNEPSAGGAIDLTMSKPKKTMLTVTCSTGMVTSVVEDDMEPVDLTAGRQTVCCDMLYRLPFTGSCRTQPPLTTTDKQGGVSNYGQHHATILEDLSKIKPFKQTDPLNKNGLVSPNDAPDGAIDLTSAKLSRDEALDYSKKGTMQFSAISTTHSSQRLSSENNTVQRSSNGVVYTPFAPPISSTFAITTQPGSIFSTTLNSLTTATKPFSTQIQTIPYNQMNSTECNQSIFLGSDPSKDILPSAIATLLPSISAFPELYSDGTLEVIAASLDALVSPSFPTFDDSKSQQYQAEHEFLQLEKLKQLCLAEELEWERQEIQRYREQEQFIVQKELEELQSIKQQLLMQQEEERKAHLIIQQETFAQQQLQLEQIQLLQQQLQQQLQEQKIYPYGFDGISQTSSSGVVLDSRYCKGDNGQYWPVKDDNILSKVPVSAPTQDCHSSPSGDLLQHSLKIPKSDDDLKETGEKKQDPEKQPAITKQNVGLSSKKISSNCVQTEEEEGFERPYPGKRRRSRKSVDSCVQTDDEDQDEWDVPVRNRRRSRSSKYSEGEKIKCSKVSSIAIQTVAEISVQTDHSGTLKKSPFRAQVDTTFDLHREVEMESDSDLTSDKDKTHSAPVEVGVNAHLKADGISITSVPKSPKVLYSPVSPVSPGKGTQKMLTAEPPRQLSSPRSLRASQRSLSDPKSLSPTPDDRIIYQYSDICSTKVSQSSTPVGSHKKIKRTLPHPPPEEGTIGSLGYSTGSTRRRICRNTTMARAKILQDIDKELDLVERESSKLRKKQAELDEEEKEIDAKLRYLEMGINRRKEVLLKEREKRERAYLQGVAEERDYMSDSEVSNNRDTRSNSHGRERPRTAPQSEFNQFIPPQTEADSHYAQLAYTHYQYASQSESPSHYSQQTLYQQPSLYQQHVSPYQTQSIYSSVPSLSQQSQQTGYDHASQLLLMQQKTRQTTLSDLEPKITTNYEVIRNQPLLIVPTSTESAYGVSHLASKYNNLDLRIGLEERGSMASSPMSSISAESFYADIDHHNVRNYVMIDDIGELTKGSRGLASSFNVPDKDISKSDRLLRVADVRRTADVSDFIGPLQATTRLHSYGKPEEDSMEEPYELKLLKQQIKQEFRRGTDGLDQLAGLPQYLHTESFRHFPKSEKYSIGRLTLEKQAAKQLSASVLYQKQIKNKRTLIDPKITKFSPIQESRDLEPDYSSFLAPTGSTMGGLSNRVRLLQDEITFGLRKNIAEQQKYLGSTLTTNLAQSLNLGHSVNLGPNLRSLPDDGTYPSGTRSRPSSRPSSVYGLDLSIKRDLSSSSLRLKSEGEGMDSQFGIARVKPTSLPISQSRGRIPIVAQNSEEESPLSPVGQPMGMARASAGPLPPISADSRDQFGSSHSLPEVQQHMREESRTRGYDRDIAFIMDDLQGAMSDSEAYHLQHEETDWFDKPREGHGGLKPGQDKRQVKVMHYPFPHTRIKLQRDPKDYSVSGGGFGIRIVGGKEIPGTNGEIGAYIANLAPAGTAELSGKVIEGMQVLEWNGIPLIGKTYEEVQSIVGQQSGEVEICLRLDLNMCSDSESPKFLELQSQLKVAEHQRSPGVDPKQLAAELQKVSQQQAPSSSVLTVLEKAGHLHSATASTASSGVPSPGQPGSPSVSKKRHNKTGDGVKPQPHPITGEIQLQINYDKNMGNLIVHVLQARNLAPRDNNGYSDPFVKVYLLPGRGAENKRRTKYVQKTQNPEWNQTVIYKNIHLEQLKRKTLEVTVWDYAKYSSNDFLGEVLIDLSNTAQLDNMPRWHPLKEQSESIHHGKGQPPNGGGGGSGGQGGQGSHGGQRGPGGSGGPGGTEGQPSNEQSPKTSVIKSRSHGIFPDPAKDTQVPTIEKSHSSPGSSKSSSESHLRSHGPSRSQSKSSVTQAHLEDAGNAIAAAEAAVQQARLQPNRVGNILNDGDGYTLDSEDGTGTNTVDSAIFQVPQLGEITDFFFFFLKEGYNLICNQFDHFIKRRFLSKGFRGLLITLVCIQGYISTCKNHMIGEIKVALKKEMKTEGEQLVLEILQCRNITYKFKSPDHLPDLYVKLYVVNVATQKRIIKKKTRVCRHDREPSFNETFRFSLNPAGHSIQLFLVSNGGKFVKKTLIGEAYIWLDKVDMRKRAVSWHKLVASSPHTQP